MKIGLLLLGLALYLGTTNAQTHIDCSLYDDPSHFMNPLDCAAYYTCHEGNLYANQCDEGLHFVNVNGGQCHYAELARCTPTACPETGISPMPVPSSCSDYLFCANGVASVRRCPEGTLFDPQLGTCNVASRVECIECPATVEFAMTPTNDCSGFFVCSRGETKRFDCEEGMLFNEAVGECDLAENAPATCTSDPENPEEPDPENPDPENPDPENPDPENPDPEGLIRKHHKMMVRLNRQR